MSAGKVGTGGDELVVVRDAAWSLIAGSLAGLGSAGTAFLVFPEPWDARFAGGVLLLFAALMTVFYWLERFLRAVLARCGLRPRRAPWRQPEIAIVGVLAALSAWASGDAQGLEHLDAAVLMMTVIWSAVSAGSAVAAACSARGESLSSGLGAILRLGGKASAADWDSAVGRGLR